MLIPLLLAANPIFTDSVPSGGRTWLRSLKVKPL